MFQSAARVEAGIRAQDGHGSSSRCLISRRRPGMRQEGVRAAWRRCRWGLIASVGECSFALNLAGLAASLVFERGTRPCVGLTVCARPGQSDNSTRGVADWS